jgi:hypothetical protein
MENLVDDLAGKSSRFCVLLAQVHQCLSKDDSLQNILPDIVCVIDIIKDAPPTSLAMVLSMVLGGFRESLYKRKVPATMVMACPEFTVMLSKVDEELSSKLYDYLCFFIDAGEFLRRKHPKTITDGRHQL